ncbi:MAG: carbohydrate ABC transporter permease [Anaerolineae bacterium]
MTSYPVVHRYGTRLRAILGQTAKFVFVLAVALLVLIPFWYMIVLSLATLQDTYVVLLVPKHFQWSNYPAAWEKANFSTLFLNSITVTVTAMTITIFIGSLAAYGFARLHFRGRDLLFNMLLLGIMVPGQTVIIPLFLTMRNLKLIDTLYSLILAYTAFGMITTIFILTNFFKGVPQALLDQAKIDGASHWSVYSRIMMPLARPAIATVGIFLFLGNWNELIIALTMIQNDMRKTVPLGLVNFVGQYRIDYGQLAAALAWATLPVLIVYVIFQRQFVRGLTAGALKF